MSHAYKSTPAKRLSDYLEDNPGTKAVIEELVEVMGSPSELALAIPDVMTYIVPVEEAALESHELRKELLITDLFKARFHYSKIIESIKSSANAYANTLDAKLMEILSFKKTEREEFKHYPDTLEKIHQLQKDKICDSLLANVPRPESRDFPNFEMRVDETMRRVCIYSIEAYFKWELMVNGTILHKGKFENVMQKPTVHNGYQLDVDGRFFFPPRLLLLHPDAALGEFYSDLILSEHVHSEDDKSIIRPALNAQLCRRSMKWSEQNKEYKRHTFLFNLIKKARRVSGYDWDYVINELSKRRVGRDIKEMR